MHRTFRLQPPVPRPDLLTRPRLLRALLGRWQHKVVCLVGGAGLGKTTLLGQALAENRLAPRGSDIWVGLEPADADGDNLARSVAQAVSDGQRTEHDAAAVADAVWRRSPSEVCLVLDDVHVLASGSAGAAWLAALIDALPVNGHILLASRTMPAIPLARLRTHGDVLTLEEDELRFSDDELVGFSARRGVNADRFDETGGWPAMVELAASVDDHLAGAYLWEEVLEPLGPERRLVLATVCDLGGADDDLASAVLDRSVDLGEELSGVPLIATDADRWRVPHQLWQTVRAIELPADERADIRRRAVDRLLVRCRFDEAFALVREAELWELADGVMREACVASDKPTAAQLARWLADCPTDVRDSTGGKLAVALHTTFTAPLDAFEPLSAAIEQCRSDGDVVGELTVIGELGRVAWWRQDLAAMGPAAVRVAELARQGHPAAQGLAAIGEAVFADVAGNDESVLAALDKIEPGMLGAGWAATARWFRARILLAMGEATAALEILVATDLPSDPALRDIFTALELGARWALGEIEAVLPAMAEGVSSSWAGVEHNRRLGHLSASTLLSYIGDLDGARRHLADFDSLPSTPATDRSVAALVAKASLLEAEGSEDAAADTLREAIEASGLDSHIERRSWRGALGLTYVLVPETREYWDRATLRGCNAQAHDLARAVVGLRDMGPRKDDERLRALELPGVSQVRALLHHRFVAELAVGLEAVGRPEGSVLLDAMGTIGRTVIRELGTRQRSAATAARALLAAVPAAPSYVTQVGVLGPLVVRRDGAAVGGSELRRERVRTLLAYLVSHRRTTRDLLMAALWPDLDEQSAANNLRVTLTYLLRLLEPDRAAGEPSFLVRLEGQKVALITGEFLTVDTDEFSAHVEAAIRAEADAAPSLALEHNLAAVELYRGDLHADTADADWVDLDREHYRSRFVAAAIRAAELMLGHGNASEAESLARRALEVDPWMEQAHGVLVVAALQIGDRSGARRRLEQCEAMLADLGVDPSEATQQLRRRLRGQTVGRER